MKLHLPQDQVDGAPEFMGGDFPIPPAGEAIPFEIVTSRDDDNEVGTLGTTTRKTGDDVGEEYQYLVIDIMWSSESGESQRHGEFFDLDRDWGLGKLRGFIEAMGHRYEEGMDLNILNGTRFTADVSHRESGEPPNVRVRANILYPTVVVEAAEAAAPKAPARPARRSAR